ncbi:MAG: glycoside hydrolase family protein [Sarcina sp.]
MTFIKTGIPLGYSVGSVVNGNTVMNMPNAQVVNTKNLRLINLKGKIYTGYIPSKGDYVKVLEIFEDKLLVLVNHNIDTEEWKIGYFALDTLVTNVMIRRNTVSWKDNSIKDVFDVDGNIIFKLSANKIVQFLYESNDNNFVCLLFNDETGALKTGYVAIDEGIFYRYPELPITLYPTKPNILDNSTCYENLEKESLETNLKVGDLTLNLKKMKILNTKDEVVFSSGYSSNLLSFIKLKEGFSANAYIDATGHWTIGYGHLIIPGDGFSSQSVINEMEAEDLLIKDLNNLCYTLKRTLKESFPNYNFVHSYELDAVLDLAYNNGLIIVSNQLEHSIFRDSMNGNYADLQTDFCEWCHGNIQGQERIIFGLYKRKLEDFIIFKTGLYIDLMEENIEELEINLKYKSKFTNDIWY